MRVRKNPSSYKKQEKERLKKKQNAINDLMLEWLAEDEPRAEAEDSVMSNDFQPEELPKLTLDLLAARDEAMDNYQEVNKDVHPMKSSKAKMDDDLDSEEEEAAKREALFAESHPFAAAIPSLAADFAFSALSE